MDFGPAAIRFWVGKYIDYGMRDAGYGINFPSSTAAAVYVVSLMSTAISDISELTLYKHTNLKALVEKGFYIKKA